MNEEIKEMLDEEIMTSITDLNNMEPGSKEKSSAVDDLVKLYRTRIEETRTMIDAEEKAELRMQEELIRKQQNEEQVKDRRWKYGVMIGQAALQMGFYALFMHKGFKFEETGSYTSKTFQNLTKFFRPTNK